MHLRPVDKRVVLGEGPHSGQAEAADESLLRWSSVAPMPGCQTHKMGQRLAIHLSARSMSAG